MAAQNITQITATGTYADASTSIIATQATWTVVADTSKLVIFNIFHQQNMTYQSGLSDSELKSTNVSDFVDELTSFGNSIL